MAFPLPLASADAIVVGLPSAPDSKAPYAAPTDDPALARPVSRSGAPKTVGSETMTNTALTTRAVTKASSTTSTEVQIDDCGAMTLRMTWRTPAFRPGLAGGGELIADYRRRRPEWSKWSGSRRPS